MAARTAGRIDRVQDDFASVVGQYDRRLRALAFRLLGEADLMDDALQDAYTRALRGYPSFRGDSDVGTWLYRIVYNACVDSQRTAAKHLHVQLESAPLPAADDWPGEGSEDLDGALSRLSPEQRAIVLLVDADGFDYAAAAEILNVPVGTVASRLARARAALRRDLKGTR